MVKQYSMAIAFASYANLSTSATRGDNASSILVAKAFGYGEGSRLAAHIRSGEALVALSAGEGLFLGVRPFVSLEMLQSGEQSLAAMTLKALGLLAGVLLLRAQVFRRT